MAKTKAPPPVKQLETPEEKKQALKNAIEQIEKSFGAGSMDNAQVQKPACFFLL